MGGTRKTTGAGQGNYRTIRQTHPIRPGNKRRFKRDHRGA